MAWLRRSSPTLPPLSEVLAGKYRVERVLGKGGMGVVVAARNLKLSETVAIKLLHARGDREPEDIARFLREGRAASRLRSEHAVRILDVGEQSDGTPFLVMEYLIGRDLGSILEERGPIEWRTATGFVLDACEAIGEAHAVGVIHRDLKPSNLFVAMRSGRSVLKVLDFGISKLTLGEPDEQLSLTVTQTFMGSPVYMAPEVMRSARAASPQSDVWSLGITLYELLSGQVPFRGESVADLCARALEEIPPPLRQFQPDIPPELDGAIARCLAKKPGARFPNVEALAEVLARSIGASSERVARLRRVIGEASARAKELASAPSAPSLQGIRVEASGKFPARRLRDATTRGAWETRASERARGRLTMTLVAAGVLAASAVAVVALARPSTQVSRAASAGVQSAKLSSLATATPPAPPETASTRSALADPVAPAAAVPASPAGTIGGAPPPAEPKIARPASSPKPAPPPKRPVGSPLFDDPN